MLTRRRFQASHRVLNNNSGAAENSTLPIHDGLNIKQRSKVTRLGESLRAGVSFCLVLIVLLVVWILSSTWSGYNIVQRDGVIMQQPRPPSVMKISSQDHANVTRFLTCIDDVSVDPYLPEINEILPRHRKKNRLPETDMYSNLPCAPPNKERCFRALYDSFADELLELAHDSYSTKDNQLGGECKWRDTAV